MNLGFGLGLTMQRSTPFTPASLFASGAEGYWPGGYDPAAGRVFQGRNGVTPTTSALQPVGLALDNSAGLSLGPELTPAPGGWTGSANWTVDVGAARGTVINSSSSADNLTLGTLSSTILGQTFRVGLTIESVSGGGLSVYSSRASGPTAFASAGVYQYFIDSTVTGAGALSLSVGMGGVSGAASGITVRHLAGYHARQPTALSRPTLMQTGGVWYLSDDGGDSLNATLPAGTYTRAYVTSTGTVTIDTGVVISGSEDTLRTAAQADVLYINRALTAGETAALTAFWGGLYS